MGIEVTKNREFLTVRDTVNGSEGMPVGSVKFDGASVEFAGWRNSLEFNANEWIMVRDWVDRQFSQAIVSYPGQGTGEAYDRSGK